MLPFVVELALTTLWRYAGEADLILAPPDLKFDDCIVYDLEAMVKDGAIDHPARLFEIIIEYARYQAKAHGRTALVIRKGRSARRSFGQRYPFARSGAATQSLEAGKHFRTQNLSKV